MSWNRERDKQEGSTVFWRERVYTVSSWLLWSCFVLLFTSSLFVFLLPIIMWCQAFAVPWDQLELQGWNVSSGHLGGVGPLPGRVGRQPGRQTSLRWPPGRLQSSYPASFQSHGQSDCQVRSQALTTGWSGKNWIVPGVNFINILRATFVRADPKSAKKTDNLTAFFAVLGYVSVKAALRTLMKLTPLLSIS